MKKITFFLLLSMVIVFSAEAHKYRNGRSRSLVTISIQTFYDELSPYGDWIYTPDYGYVWRPYFDYPEAFRPYSSNGYWVNTDYGWTWVSDYRWGWATFHYGRWAFDDYLGWMWVPGYEWAPAWVTWGNYGDYYGWAPMGPNVFAYSTSTWYAPDPWWTFVPRRHFCADNWNNYIYDRPVHVTNITHITNVYINNGNNNTNNSWYYGPRVSDVERYSNNKVRRMEVVESQRSDNTGISSTGLRVYRPSVNNNRNEARPNEFRNAEQARSERRIQPTNARTNNPGINHTRENKTGSRNSTQINGSRNTSNSGTRVEPRTSTQVPVNRTEAVKRDTKTTPGSSSQTQTRNTPANRDNKVEPRTTPKQSNQTTSTQAEDRNRVQPSKRERNTSENERKNAAVNPSRGENTENRRNTTATPSRDQKPQNPGPEVRTRPGNAEKKQTEKHEVKQAETRTSATPAERSSSAKPTRR